MYITYVYEILSNTHCFALVWFVLHTFFWFLMFSSVETRVVKVTDVSKRTRQSFTAIRINSRFQILEILIK